ncbi:MAG: hypothetical protein OQK12_12065 [Motiliproteus sp.]|nr:hypothetical protein [Motiliproteus sp.]MCW9051042.1 hypothetical protein [Motiliproteus sp.]
MPTSVLADQQVIPYVEIKSDRVEYDPDRDTEIGVDGYSDPFTEYRDKRFDPAEEAEELVIDESHYTEIPAGNIEEEMPESDFPVTEVDGFSGGLFDSKTVYRDMGDRYDSEPMVVIVPGADPDRALPPPTVVPVDSFGAETATVVPVDRIDLPVPSKEDRIFNLFSGTPEAPKKVPNQKPDRKERVLIPMSQPKPSNSGPIEIITTN